MHYFLLCLVILMQYVPGELMIGFDEEVGLRMTGNICESQSQMIILTGDEYLDQIGNDNGLLSFQPAVNLTELCASVEDGELDNLERIWVGKFISDGDILQVAELYAVSEHVRYAEKNAIPQPAADGTQQPVPAATATDDVPEPVVIATPDYTSAQPVAPRNPLEVMLAVITGIACLGLSVVLLVISCIAIFATVMYAKSRNENHSDSDDLAEPDDQRSGSAADA